MYKVSWFFRISAVATLAMIVAVASLAGGFGSSANAATKAATAPAVKLFDVCTDPTATPVATTAATTVATKAATSAATTSAATKAATVAATKAATVAATAAAPTTVPPTATGIPKGQKPASARFVLRSSAKLKRGGAACVEVFSTDVGGPAAVAGILKSDLILGIDTVVVKSAKDVYDQIEKKSSGDKVLLTVQRGKDVIAFSVTLGLNQFANPAAATGAATKAATTVATKAATKAATPAATKAK